MKLHEADSPAAISPPRAGLGTTIGRIGRSRPRRATAIGLAAAFALLHVLLAVPAALQDGPTVDEPPHILSGYAILTENRYDIDRMHPVLSRAILALPLVPLGAEPPPDPLYHRPIVSVGVDASGYAVDFLYRHNPGRTAALLLLPRLMVVVVSAAMVGAFSYALFRLTTVSIGLTVSSLLAFDPTLLAHGHLATTDSITAFFYGLTGLCFLKFARGHRRRWLLLGGVAAGLTMAAKVTGLLVWPALAVAIVLDAVSDSAGDENGPKRRWAGRLAGYVRRHGVSIALMLFLGFLTLWAVYRFQLKPLPVDAPLLARAVERAERVPIPIALYELQLPLVDYARTLLAGIIGNNRGRVAFLAGELYQGANFLFFPVTLALKSTVGFLLLLVLGLLTTLARLLRPAGFPQTPRGPALDCIVFMAVIIAFASVSSFNLGIRYLLPALPFAYLLIGLALAAFSIDLRGGVAIAARFALVLLVASSCLSVLSVAPNYLTYFNVLAGGPSNGHRWLVDSNLDWGQGIDDLGPYLARNATGRIYLEYFGGVPPAEFGVDAIPLKRATADVPPGCTIAISATALRTDPHPAVRAFAALPPDDLVANSILIYRSPAACATLAELQPGAGLVWTGW